MLLRDIRFQFDYDNPFQNDSTKRAYESLRKVFKTNPEKFYCEDPMKYIRFLSVSDIKTLFGKEVNDTTELSTNPLENKIKSFILKCQELKDYPIYKWSSNINPDLTTEIEIENEIVENNFDNDDIENHDDELLPEEPQNYEDFIPNIPSQYTYSKTSGLTNYDISSDKCLTYEDVRKLTVNIARSKLVPDIQKDESVILLEKQKRKELMHDINRYRNLDLISSMIDDDITDMNIDQLEEVKDRCTQQFERAKLMDVCKKTTSIGGAIYNSVFPDGIKITKTKRLKLKGVGKGIIECLFDPRTTTGIAFSNTLAKKNIHVSDSVLLMISICGNLVGKIEIEDIKSIEEPDTTNTLQIDNEKIEDNNEEYDNEEEEEDDYEETDDI